MKLNRKVDDRGVLSFLEVEEEISYLNLRLVSSLRHLQELCEVQTIDFIHVLVGSLIVNNSEYRVDDGLIAADILEGKEKYVLNGIILLGSCENSY